jgi:hypothetical protein
MRSLICAIVLLGVALRPPSGYDVLKLEAGVWDADLSYLDAHGKRVHQHAVQRNTLMPRGLWMVNDLYMPGMTPRAARYHGHGVWGYDAERHMYTGIWVDAFYQTMRHDMGTFDPKTSTLYWTGEQSDGRGHMAHVRNVERFLPNKRVFEMYYTNWRTGKETLCGTLTFSRRPGASDPSAADDTDQLP